jgi:hypothetical protein
VIRDVAQILVETPDEPPRSRLDPYCTQILRWRRRGKSYRRIQKLLAENWQVQITYEALRQFVHRRNRARKGEPEVESSQMELVAENEPVAVVPAKRPAEEIAAAREAARAVNQPVFEKKQEVKPRFVYDPSKPPVNKNYV